MKKLILLTIVALASACACAVGTFAANDTALSRNVKTRIRHRMTLRDLLVFKFVSSSPADSGGASFRFPVEFSPDCNNPIISRIGRRVNAFKRKRRRAVCGVFDDSRAGVYTVTI